MKSSNVFLKSAVAVALVGAFGAAGAATISATGGARDFALETCQAAATTYTLPAAVYTIGAGGSATQDFYVTFTLSNGVFAATPTATPVTAGSAGETATYIAGGAGSASVTFRLNGSVASYAPNDTVTLVAGATAKATSCSSPIEITATNGLLFISGTVASPLEGVTNGATPNSIATFTQAVTINMPETGTDPIDLNPSPSTNSRKVFGPASALDAAAGTSPSELTNMAARRVTITIGAQREPDNSGPFADVIDDLVVSLDAGFNASSISSAAGEGLCFDLDGGADCDAGELFNLTTGVATIDGTWATNGGFLLFNDGTAFAPRTLTLNYALAVKANAVRPGMTAHTYTYTAPTNNAWAFAYANGTLLRSQWFLSDPNNTSTLRLVNAGSSAAAVVDATYRLDSGATGQIVGLTSVAAQSGKNLQLNATSVPGLSTGTASRGYVEVTIAGDLANVEGSVITSGNVSGDRTIGVMRNVTLDQGLRQMNTPF